MGSNNHAVRLLSVADRDLQELISYLAAENPDAAATALDRLETQLQGLQRHPLPRTDSQ